MIRPAYSGKDFFSSWFGMLVISAIIALLLLMPVLTSARSLPVYPYKISSQNLGNHYVDVELTIE